MVLITSLTLGTKNIFFTLKDTVIGYTANRIGRSFLLLQQVVYLELKIAYPLFMLNNPGPHPVQ